MTSKLRLFSLLPLLALGACADFATEPDRVPTSLRIDRSLVTTTVGNDVTFNVTVLDQDGQAMDVPAWGAPRWTVESDAVLDPISGGVKAEAPGASKATASLAGLSSEVTVRVNPATLKLVVAEVIVEQEGSKREKYAANRPVTLYAYLTADQINFFKPRVRATILQNGTEVGQFDMSRSDEGVPRTLNTDDKSNAWVTQIPGNLIKPGVSIVVEADPEGSIPRASGSADRFPGAGVLALEVTERTLQLRVSGFYLNQSVQTLARGVPLISGREALLRVFLTGNVGASFNDFNATAKATFYLNGAVQNTVTLTRGQGVPSSINEAELSASWNATIPGSWLVPGLAIVVEGVPTDFGLEEGSVTRVPEVGQTPLDVRAAPKFWLRFVPVHQNPSGARGVINSGNMGDYVRAAREIFPIADYDADLRATYFTDSATSGDGGWEAILREMLALRAADGSGRYYYGVVRRDQGGTAGLGYIGLPASIGFDDPQLGPWAFAHELGHNFSLRHAPCGGAGGVDPAFPYAGGFIGVYGYDIFAKTLRFPTGERDIMSYCRPSWISDFHYNKALQHRLNFDPSQTGPIMTAKEKGLLVWGGVQQGRPVLEPAFELDLPRNLPEGVGPYRIEGFDANGQELFSYRFRGAALDHEAGMNFAYTIPATVAQPDRLARIRLTGPEGTVERVRQTDRPTIAESRVPGGTSLRVTSGRGMALVRDRATGEILSFVRDGEVTLPSQDVEVLLSDGVRTWRPLRDQL